MRGFNFHVLVALTAVELRGYAIMGAAGESSARWCVWVRPRCTAHSNASLTQASPKDSARRPAKGDDQRHRYYRLTDLGQQVCWAEADRLAELVNTTRTNLRPGLA